MKKSTKFTVFARRFSPILGGPVAIALMVGVSGCGGSDDPETTVTKVTYQSLDPVKPLTVPAEFRQPEGKSVPAVVIVHGSSGIDSRGISYAKELNQAGIATFEIDLWAARGITGPAGRPRSVPETLPDAYGALKYLSNQPNIDAKRIGIMGFSWGGVVSMLTATDPYTKLYMNGTNLAFAAHAPNYPVCWVYNNGIVPGYEFKAFTGKKIFVQGGDLDTYDLPGTCPALAASVETLAPGLLSVKMYAGATHGFDRTEPTITINDPFAHLGRGGVVEMTPNLEVAAKARAATVAFFRAQFGM